MTQDMPKKIWATPDDIIPAFGEYASGHYMRSGGTPYILQTIADDLAEVVCELIEVYEHYCPNGQIKQKNIARYQATLNSYRGIK